MDATSRSTLSSDVSGAHPDSIRITDLPDDIYPVVFARLQERELLMLPSVNKRFSQLAQPLIQHKAAEKLHATLPLPEFAQWEPLLTVFRKHAHQITLSDWSRFLVVVRNADKHVPFVKALLLAPNVAAKNAEIVQLTNNSLIQFDDEELLRVAKLAASTCPPIWNDTRHLDKEYCKQIKQDHEIAKLVIAGALKYQLRIEFGDGCANPVHREQWIKSSNWASIENAVQVLPPLLFAELMLMMNSSDKIDTKPEFPIAKVFIEHLKWFDKHMATDENGALNWPRHSADELQFWMLAPSSQEEIDRHESLQALCRKKNFQHEFWFGILAATHKLKPAKNKKTYIETIMSSLWSVCWFGDIVTKPWHSHLPAFSRCTFIALIYETGSQENHFPLYDAIAKSNFIAECKVRDLINFVKTRMAELIPLDTAVDQWMDQNRVKQNRATPGCIIS